MDRGTPTLDRLVNAARRKWIAVRAVEHAAVGAIAGAALAAGAAGVLWWNARPSLGVAATLIGSATLLGAAFSLLRRPSRVATARRLDEQHRLHDLFSTAATLDERDDPAMASIVRALASSSARRVAQGESLNVARWGGRGYASAAMAVSMAIALSAVASQDSVVTGRADTPAAAWRGAPGRDEAESPRMTAAGPSSTESGEDRLAERVGGLKDTAPAAAPPDARPGAAADGASAASTGDRAAPLPPDPGIARQGLPPQGAERSPFGQGRPAPDRSDSSDAVTGPVLRAPLPASDPAPFPSRLGPIDRAAAEQAIRRGAVPEAYRDLVREYFLRD